MKPFSLILIMLFLLSACGPAPTPAAPTPDAQGTMDAMVADIVAATLTAQPSSTLPAPTSTLIPPPSATPSPAPTATDTAIPPTQGPTETPFSGIFSPGNTDGLPTGLLRIENLTGEKEIIVTLNGITTLRQQPVYYSYLVNGALNITIFWASYDYIIQIPNKRIFTGTFTQGSKDKTTIKVYLRKDPSIQGP